MDTLCTAKGPEKGTNGTPTVPHGSDYQDPDSDSTLCLPAPHGEDTEAYRGRLVMMVAKALGTLPADETLALCPCAVPDHTTAFAVLYAAMFIAEMLGCESRVWPCLNAETENHIMSLVEYLFYAPPRGSVEQ